jgi:spermidine/putrescine transport system permease protein
VLLLGSMTIILIFARFAKPGDTRDKR